MVLENGRIRHLVVGLVAAQAMRSELASKLNSCICCSACIALSWAKSHAKEVLSRVFLLLTLQLVHPSSLQEKDMCARVLLV